MMRGVAAASVAGVRRAAAIIYNAAWFAFGNFIAKTDFLINSNSNIRVFVKVHCWNKLKSHGCGALKLKFHYFVYFDKQRKTAPATAPWRTVRRHRIIYERIKCGFTQSLHRAHYLDLKIYARVPSISQLI